MIEEVSALQDNGETKNKAKIQYSVQIVSDGEKGTGRHFMISLRVFVVFLVAVALLIVAALSYCFILAGELNRSNSNVELLTTRAEKLAMQNEELLAEKEEMVRENEELQEKVEIFSDTINGKVQQEQEREAELAQTYIPTGFPLKGSATYNESVTELDGNPIAVFHASQGTSVVATANGTVSSIAGDTEAGYIVMIDHGNGYFTVYRNGAHPSVEKGDAVTKTTKLFDIERGKEELGYQIIENEKYIDPLSLMETYG